jgi:hypothetical protein
MIFKKLIFLAKKRYFNIECKVASGEYSNYFFPSFGPSFCVAAYVLPLFLL